MLVNGKVNQELKLTAKCNEGTREISAGDRGAVSRIKQKEDGLHRHADGVTFVRHDFKALVQITIDSFHQHRIVVASR